ncbi:hypothetical protein D3C81_1398910 [compost metagenome]
MNVKHFEVTSDRTQLCSCHQATSSNHHEHCVHDPENWFTQNFAWLVVTFGLLNVCDCIAFFVFRSTCQEQCNQNHDDALADTEVQERILVAAGSDHCRDRNDGHSGTSTETSSGQASCQAATVREPFQCVTNASTVHSTSADTADYCCEVQGCQRISERVDEPTQAAQDTANQNHWTWTEFIYEPTFDRYQPCFGQNEDRECNLNCSAAPAVFCCDRIDEQRPTVLQVCNHCHCNDTQDQLHPAVGC